jgi:poly(3-hydroxybutyrate) depolymerase
VKSNTPLALALALAALATGAGATPLPALNVDTSKISISGLSSGAFMANQMGYAYASTFMGVGVFAGGPYMCAGHSNYTACMYNATISASQLGTMQTDITHWSGTSNDAVANVAAQKVFLWVGSSDTTVGPNPMAAVRTQYTNNGVTAANLSFNQLSGAAHTFPTDFAGSGDNACGTASSPYISNCSYDGAGAMLKQFYGALNARNNAPASGNYIQFDQTPYTAGNPGMASTGWIYVPANCASGTQCKLHVALHGCLQNYATVGADFIQNTGYTRWADTNSLIVLFPQTQVDNTSRSTAASGSLANPNGCWDWIGWYGSSFARKAGTQAAALKAMVDHVASGIGSGGGGGTGALASPTGLGTSGATASSMTLAWAGASGATGYNVYRGGTKVNPATVTATSYVDTGLAAATTYTWTVTDLNSGGVESAQSTAASGTTTGTAATCTTASNYAHTTAGRAHQSGGYAYANGSNQNMGLWNLYVTTTLKETAANNYVIGTCP